MHSTDVVRRPRQPGDAVLDDAAWPARPLQAPPTAVVVRLQPPQSDPAVVVAQGGLPVFASLVQLGAAVQRLLEGRIDAQCRLIVGEGGGVILSFRRLV